MPPDSNLAGFFPDLPAAAGVGGGLDDLEVGVEAIWGAPITLVGRRDLLLPAGVAIVGAPVVVLWWLLVVVVVVVLVLVGPGLGMPDLFLMALSEELLRILREELTGGGMAALMHCARMSSSPSETSDMDDEPFSSSSSIFRFSFFGDGDGCCSSSRVLS